MSPDYRGIYQLAALHLQRTIDEIERPNRSTDCPVIRSILPTRLSTVLFITRRGRVSDSIIQIRIFGNTDLKRVFFHICHTDRGFVADQFWSSATVCIFFHFFVVRLAREKVNGFSFVVGRTFLVFCAQR